MVTNKNLKFLLLFAISLICANTQIEAKDYLYNNGNSNSKNIISPSINDTIVYPDNIAFRRSGKNDFTMTIAGYDITFGNTGSKPRRSFKFYMVSNLELGFNFLSNESKSFELNNAKSIHFGLDIFEYIAKLDPTNNRFLLSTGINIKCDNYTFDDNITLKKVGGNIITVPLIENYKKSKLTATYLGIPLRFKYKFTKSFGISAGGYADLLLSAHTKYKKPKNKEKISGLNPIQCGVGGAITIECFGLYVKYSLTPLFRNDVGPNRNLLSTGFYWGF
jgi:hypothetical protein